jgi:hypothetical protein
MKAKILFIITLLLLQGKSLFPQCISIELSVTWEMGFDIFEKDYVMSIPILNIIYRNNWNTNCYFFKVSPKKDGVGSMAGCRGLLQYDEPDDKKLAMASCGRYANEHFNVIMGSVPFSNAIWKVFRDTADYNNEQYFGAACGLENIYKYLFPVNLSNYEKLLPVAFKPSDITPENILNSIIKDKFVFLKAGETHIDTYNLIGFKLVEGCFTFIIDKNAIKDYVLCDGMDGLGILEIALPAVIDDYQLYSGKFNTNKVTVCFGER